MGTPGATGAGVGEPGPDATGVLPPSCAPGPARRYQAVPPPPSSTTTATTMPMIMPVLDEPGGRPGGGWKGGY
jgi:hypothetical protein